VTYTRGRIDTIDCPDENTRLLETCRELE
jgi:hypothetical protein